MYSFPSFTPTVAQPLKRKGDRKGKDGMLLEGELQSIHFPFMSVAVIARQNRHFKQQVPLSKAAANA